MSARHHTLWTDPNLAEAYDIVNEVMTSHLVSMESDFQSLLSEIDRADRLLAEIKRERLSTPSISQEGE